MTADHGDRPGRVEIERGDVGEREELGVGMGMKLELRPQRDVAAFHFFRRADVEDLQWLPAVEPLREFLRGNLWQRGVRHGR